MDCTIFYKFYIHLGRQNTDSESFNYPRIGVSASRANVIDLKNFNLKILFELKNSF